MPPQFTLAEMADLDRLLELNRQLHDFFNEPFEGDFTRQAMAGLIADRSLGRLWLIQAGDQSVGYVVLTLSYSLEYGGREAFIDELFIQSDHRQQGIGTATLAFVDDQCQKLGIRALHLEVDRDNAPARHLYAKAGFVTNSRYLMTRRYP